MELTRDADVRSSHSRDASGLQLTPDAVARASTPGDVVAVVEEALRTGVSVTPAGSQTSMTGASITGSGILLSLAPMTRIIDVDVERRTAHVEPGITIGELNRSLRETGLMFAPDPTSENDATIGGAIACNASGARSLRYGATRSHVNGLTIVHADASKESYSRAFLEKNTVGFSAAQDPVDWFVGSEGTLGIVVAAVLSLVPRPTGLVGLAIPFRSQGDALKFIVEARSESARKAQCLEFLDEQALKIAGNASGRPWDSSAMAVVYLEDDTGEANGSELETWLALADANNAIADDIRVFEGDAALRDARAMRHAVPATMNETGARYLAQGGRKVSTDWAVPYRKLAHALDASRVAAERHGAPEPVTYGHGGNGHPHQNFIAENHESLQQIHAAIDETLQTVFAIGGTFSAEHGVGKLKKTWLERQMTTRQIEVMKAMKHALDPHAVFSPGNIL